MGTIKNIISVSLEIVAVKAMTHWVANDMPGSSALIRATEPWMKRRADFIHAQCLFGCKI